MRLVALSTIVVLAACDPGNVNDSQQGVGSSNASANACMAGQPDGHVCDPADTKKTTICHIPPGNPANAHTLCVGNSAVPAHLDHGDHLGACSSECGGDPAPTGDTTGSTGGTTGGPHIPLTPDGDPPPPVS